MVGGLKIKVNSMDKANTETTLNGLIIIGGLKIEYCKIDRCAYFLKNLPVKIRTGIEIERPVIILAIYYGKILCYINCLC